MSNIKLRPVPKARARVEVTSNEAYTCPELQRPPGVPEERFAAFELPSRVGDTLYYPNGETRCVTD